MFGLLGGLMSGAMSMFGQSQTNQMQMSMLQEQERYNTTMANSAYQRASTDMQKAGLNPMMMFGSGGPAQTPGIQTPSLTSPIQAAGKGFDQGVASSIALRTADAQVETLIQKLAQQKADAASAAADVPVHQLAGDTASRQLGIPSSVKDIIDRYAYGANSAKAGGDLSAIAGGTLAAGSSVVNSAKSILPSSVALPELPAAVKNLPAALVGLTAGRGSVMQNINDNLPKVQAPDWYKRLMSLIPDNSNSVRGYSDAPKRRYGGVGDSLSVYRSN